MRALFGAGVVLVLWVCVALAAPRKILVLPLDGNVDAALRTRLNARVQGLAQQLDGKVSVGDATFDETAAAVGCDREAPACAEAVRAMLGVDELVYGRVIAPSTLHVHRVRSKTAYRDASAEVSEDDAAIDAQLAELFDLAPPPPPPAPVPPPPPPPAPSTSPRLRGVLITVGGGVALLTGVILWANVASAQDDIDAADPRTADDFRTLREREDKAQRNAIIGDVLVVAGLGLTAWGAWTIYQSRTSEVTIAPTASATGAGVTIGGHW